MRSPGSAPAAARARAITSRQIARSPRVYPTTVGLPLVPAEACRRASSRGGTAEIVDAVNPRRIASGRGDGLSIDRHALRGPRAGMLEALALEDAQMLARGRLHLAIPDHGPTSLRWSRPRRASSADRGSA